MSKVAMKLLTVSQIAARFNVNVSTARRWCNHDLLPGAFRVPGKTNPWLIPKAALDGFTPPKRGYPAGRPRKTNSIT
jgi:hypothetical protein